MQIWYIHCCRIVSSDLTSIQVEEVAWWVQSPLYCVPSALRLESAECWVKILVPSPFLMVMKFFDWDCLLQEQNGVRSNVGEWSDQSKSNQTTDQNNDFPGSCGHDVRFWPVKDRQE